MDPPISKSTSGGTFQPQVPWFGGSGSTVQSFFLWDPPTSSICARSVGGFFGEWLRFSCELTLSQLAAIVKAGSSPFANHMLPLNTKKLPSWGSQCSCIASDRIDRCSIESSQVEAFVAYEAASRPRSHPFHHRWAKRPNAEPGCCVVQNGTGPSKPSRRRYLLPPQRRSVILGVHEPPQSWGCWARERLWSNMTNIKRSSKTSHHPKNPWALHGRGRTFSF